MRLAAYVAHTTDVNEMLDGMTPRQWDEWVAYDQVEPIGQEPGRGILALIGCLVRSFMSKGSANPADFMPWLKGQDMDREMSPEEIKFQAQTIPGARHGVRR